ncbi:MAG: hypothetical protein H5T84_09855 [Thermoleophilia bacterium]|nr:hypothetical protein [Thermoleophilia bacterium]
MPIDPADIRLLLDRALAGPARELAPGVEMEGNVLELIAEAGLGDARRALTILERSLVLARARRIGRVDADLVQEAAQRKLVLYDKDEDAHYDVISAFIKSMRGSDPDAALYYLAVMLTGGEDPRFIARRMVIFASEDIGNADPRALQVATAVAQAVEFVGLPECRINLAQGVTYLSCAPKSNASYLGIEAALAEVQAHGAQYPPAFLRSTGYSGARKLGHGVGYEYPHEQGGYGDQSYLPSALAGREFYQPTENGLERRMKGFLAEIRARRRRRRETEGSSS